MINIYIVLMPFIEVLIGGISIAEYISVIFIGIALYRIRRYYQNHASVMLLIFVFWVLFSYLIHSAASYFLLSSFLNNLFRLLAYVFGFFLIPVYIIQTNSINRMVKLMMYVLLTISVMSIIEFIGNQIGLNIQYQIEGYSYGTMSTRYGTRIRGVFSEPAHLSIFIGTFASLIVAFYRNRVKDRFFKVVFVLAMITLLLTTSMIGFSILLLLIGTLYIYSFESSRSKNVRRVKNTIIVIFALTIVTSILSNSLLFNDLIFFRVEKIMNQDDASGNMRLIGSWEYAFASLDKYPYFGAGIGQLQSHFQTLTTEFKNYWTEQSGGINNIMASVLIQTGIGGFILFLIFSFFTFRSDKLMFLFFVFLCFSWGYFNTPLFWFYIYVWRSMDTEFRSIVEAEM